MNLLRKVPHFIFLCTLITGCTSDPAVTGSEPLRALANVPAGFSYTCAWSDQPYIYRKAAGAESDYKFQPCDSAIGTEAYNALMKYMKTYQLSDVTISADRKILVFEPVREPGRYIEQASLYSADAIVDVNATIAEANKLYFGTTYSITQHLQIDEHWLRITHFQQDIDSDYLFPD